MFEEVKVIKRILRQIETLESEEAKFRVLKYLGRLVEENNFKKKREHSYTPVEETKQEGAKQ